MRKKRGRGQTDKMEAGMVGSLEKSQGEIWKGRIQISKENLLLELDHLTMFCGKGQLATLKEQSE